MPPISKKRKAYNRAHKAEQHEYKLKRNYGVTMEMYLEMLAEQGDRCALCGVSQEEVSVPFVVDHNHETGRVRGLLCNNCNHGLGRFKDSIILLQAAIVYLKKEGDNDGTNRPEG